MRNSRLGILSVLFASAGLIAPTLGSAQTTAPGSGTFQALYPEVHTLIVASEAVHRSLLERVATELGEHAMHMPAPVDPSAPADHSHMDMPMAMPAASEREVGVYGELVRELRAAAEGGEVHDHAMAGEDSGLTTRLRTIVDRTHALQRQILDIHADPGITDKISAVDRVVADYLSDPMHSLPAVPKSMDLLHRHTYATTFGVNFPYLRGLVWTSYWLQFATFEPLFLLDTTEQRRAGMTTVAERFWRKLDSPPSAFPAEMPMVPTISPGLRARHPEVSAIFDNLHMMLGVVSDLIVHEAVTDKAAAVEAVIDEFSDPTYETVSQYDWTLMALRHGIFDQGGPALGTLERSERNRPMMDHTQHGGQAILPGMPVN